MTETDIELTTFINSSVELIQSVDREGNFLFVNTSWQRTLGYDDGELRRMDLRTLLSPECRDAFLGIFQHVLNGVAANGVEACFRTKDGSSVAVRGTIVPRIVGGEVIGAQSIFTDVTEQRKAEAEMMMTENRFRTLFDTMMQGVIYRDHEGRVIMTNPAASSILGLTEEQLFGREPKHPQWHAIRQDGSSFPDEEHPALVALRTGRPVAGAVMGVYRPERGEYRWIRINAIPEFTGGSGVPVQVFTTFSDFTEQKRMQDQLEFRLRIEEEINAISARFVGTTEATLDADVNTMLAGIGRLMKMDRTFIFLYDERMESVCNTHEWCAQGIEPQIQNLQETPVSAFEGWDLRLRQNEVIYIPRVSDLPEEWKTVREILEAQSIKSNLSVPLYVAGQPLGFVGFDNVLEERRYSEVDISLLRTVAEILAATFVRLRREASLRDQNRRLNEQAELLNQASDYILVAQYDGPVTFANASARILLRIAEDDLGRRHFRELLGFSEEQHDVVLAELRSRRAWNGEVSLANPEGKDRLCQCSLTLLVDERQEPDSVLVICSDITDRKEVERSLMRAQRMETVGTLAGGIAHDLNNILGPIMVGIEMLKRNAADERSVKLLHTMESSAHRGARIVKQVLAFGRGMTSDKMLLSPKHIVKEVVEMVRETFPKNITIDTGIAANIRSMNADATQLHQVLLNLVVNSRDAMPRGGTIRLFAENFDVDESFSQLHREAKPGHYVRFSVDDSGTGISQDVIDRIFEPFFTTKEVGKGTGLGLSTVQSIVHNHDGFIDVYSDIGRGTSFKVYIPAIPGDAAAEGEGKSEDDFPLGNRETVLVVDDEASVREIAATTLQSFNYEVLVASDGAEGLAVYSENKERIGVILSDMMMPFLDGPSMIRALKKINPKVRVIGMSGLKTEDREKMAVELGVRYFIEKPYTANTLLKTIKLALTASEGVAA